MTISFCKLWVETFQLPEGSHYPWSVKRSQQTACLATESPGLHGNMYVPSLCGAPGPMQGSRNRGKNEARSLAQTGFPLGWADTGGMENTVMPD